MESSVSRDAALYHVVLGHWRRCHGEGAVLAKALREAEAEAADARASARADRRETAISALGRVVRWRRDAVALHALRRWSSACVEIRHRGAHAKLAEELLEAESSRNAEAQAAGVGAASERFHAACATLGRCIGARAGLALQRTLHTWSAACMRLALQRSAELVRRERAALMEAEARIMEAEAQLALAQEAEQEVRRKMQSQQEQDLALMAALSGQQHVTQQQPPPPPPPPQLPPALLPPVPTLQRERLAAVPKLQREQPESKPPAASAARPLGTRAESLVAAFRRESAAAG